MKAFVFELMAGNTPLGMKGIRGRVMAMKNNSDSQNACLAGFMSGAVLLLLATLSACNRDQPQVIMVPAPAAAQAAPVAVVAAPPEIIAQDDYVYYPQYEVYFSSSRHQYVYPENGVWVSRPAPPQVAVNVLLASPSVHMDFHDSPAAHHADVVRSYPHNFAPAARGRDGRGPGG
jgi:hypothetical protein